MNPPIHRCTQNSETREHSKRAMSPRDPIMTRARAAREKNPPKDATAPISTARPTSKTKDATTNANGTGKDGATPPRTSTPYPASNNSSQTNNKPKHNPHPQTSEDDKPGASPPNPEATLLVELRRILLCIVSVVGLPLLFRALWRISNIAFAVKVFQELRVDVFFFALLYSLWRRLYGICLAVRNYLGARLGWFGRRGTASELAERGRSGSIAGVRDREGGFWMVMDGGI
jgi:hypothetical protein